MAGLRPVVNDEQLAVLRILVDRRRSLGEEHTRMVSQFHQLLLELIPGGAKKGLSAAQAKALLATVRPRDIAGKDTSSGGRRTHRRPRADLPAQEGRQQRAQGARCHAEDRHGIGPSGAARLLVEVGDITRFLTCGHFASWNGTAPIDASSGDKVRHRLSRAGNLQINRVLHMMATVQLCHPTQGRAYYDRKKAVRKTSMEAMPCVKRRLSDIVFLPHAQQRDHSYGEGPGGQR